MGTNLGYCLYLIGHVLRRIETVFLSVKEQANERKDRSNLRDCDEPRNVMSPGGVDLEDTPTRSIFICTTLNYTKFYRGRFRYRQACTRLLGY